MTDLALAIFAAEFLALHAVALAFVGYWAARVVIDFCKTTRRKGR